MHNKRKPIKHGCDFVRGSGWKPKIMTRRGAQRYADRQAKAALPHGFWTGRVSDCGDYYRINICGDPVNR